MVTDYLALRAVIGLIAFFLVPVVYVGNWLLFTRHVGACFWPNPRLPDSLSGYYYTHMRNLFVGAMCAMGIFLAAYRGFDRWDSRFTNVHMGSLIVLFAMVFLMVLVQFTMTGGQDRGDPAGGLRAWWNSVFFGGIRTWWKSLFPHDARNRKKKRRNLIYVLCAGGILLCALLALVTAIAPSVGTTAPLLLYAECFAFAFFGIAWYVKGAASITPGQPQLLIWVLSRPVYRWLADDPAS
jgi:hypothetical protein